MPSSMISRLSVLCLAFSLSGCGGGNSGGGGGGGGNPPLAPTWAATFIGDQTVTLQWHASTGATSYHVKRSTTSGGPYTQIASSSATQYTDAGLTNGTTYYYVVSALNGNGESANSTEMQCKPIPLPPGVPTGLTATPGDRQVALSWNAVSGVLNYNVKRSTTSGGSYQTAAGPLTNSFTDTNLTNGRTYYYVVSAVNGNGESANSSEVSATPTGPSPSVVVTVNTLANRHTISPYIYGGAYPKDAATITDSGLTVVRWGGNATSRYNWKTQTSNSANDWWFSDYTYKEVGTSDSVKFVQDTKTAGSNPLMTMVMMDWVSRGDPANGTGNGQLYSYSKAKYGAQCNYRPDNSDAGNGQQSDCSTNVTGNDPNDAHVPIFDDNTTSCPASAKGPCVYRKDWASALATAFGASPHFYDMDNEADIWGGTHHDVHPDPTGYDELRDTYLRLARGMRTWDPAAIRLGPVSCCWWFYWNGPDPSNDPNNDNKITHAGIDFVPWLLNEIYWQDQIAGTRSLDVFDVHAYPDAPNTSNWSITDQRKLATRIYRDYWDRNYFSESPTVNQNWATFIQPNKTIPFRIPRMRAIVNMIYPGTPLAFTEWSAAFAGSTPAQREADFSTAIGDADAYGIMGRERMYLASRWLAPDPANPNYQALKIYTNYDGAHHGFATVSVAATHDTDVDLFSSFAALNTTATAATVVLINKDPSATLTAQVTLNGFSPNQVTSYTLSSAAPTSIVKAGPVSWPTSSMFTLAPYSITLLAITGSMAQVPAAEWDLNPDVIVVPAGGTVTLAPKIVSGSGTVTLSSPQSDTGITVTLTQPNLTTTQNGTITVTAGGAGFCDFTITGTDNSGVTQTQSGWIVVGNPPAALSKTGDPGGGPKGTNINLQVTLSADSSGGTDSGASIFFTTDAGSLSSRIVKTNGSGQATVTLTLPNSAATVHVRAEGPFALGHPVATFTEASQ